MKRVLSTLAVVLMIVSLALAADFWNSKPYSKWSQADATRLLTNSPWAKTTPMRTGRMAAGSRPGVQAVADAEVEPTIQYSVSIRSATPVRQANARMAAIVRKYDKMDEGAKRQFDDRWNKYLEMKFPDTIVIAVNYESNVPGTDQQLLLYFQAQTLETMKSTTVLILPDGKRVQPTAFAAGAHEMQIAFPRPNNMPPESSFSVEFKHPDMPDQPSRVINGKFSLKEMVFNGAVTY
jgi:hypothetical protein